MLDLPDLQRECERLLDAALCRDARHDGPDDVGVIQPLWDAGQYVGGQRWRHYQPEERAAPVQATAHSP